jgi:hypothetical protein
MNGFTELGLTPGQAMEVLTGRPVFESFSQGSALDGIFDASDREEGGDMIIWLNDLENDARYSRWPQELESVRHNLDGKDEANLNRFFRSLHLIIPALSTPLGSTSGT